jgi:hypothetical protein
MKPAANRNGTLRTGRPCQIVASQAKTATALGIEITRLAALKKSAERSGIPVANMWCTQTPKPRMPVETVASATKVYPTSGRRQNVGIRSDMIPMAGSTTM